MPLRRSNGASQAFGYRSIGPASQAKSPTPSTTSSSSTNAWRANWPALSRVVGKEGKLGQRCSLGDVGGFWDESVDSVNELIDDLVHPTSETARVIGAVAQGDLSQTMALEIDDRPLQGEFLRTAKTINKMVDQLGSFASRSDPRGPRSRHRRQARRPGQSERRGRHLERPDRQRELAWPAT